MNPYFRSTLVPTLMTYVGIYFWFLQFTRSDLYGFVRISSARNSYHLQLKYISIFSNHFYRVSNSYHLDPSLDLSTMVAFKATCPTVQQNVVIILLWLLKIHHLLIKGKMIKFWWLLISFPHHKTLPNLRQIMEHFNIFYSLDLCHRFTKESLHSHLHHYL